MCGRYALAIRAGQVRQRLQESNMPSQDSSVGDETRETYNFAPGNIGLVYRAERPYDEEQQEDKDADALKEHSLEHDEKHKLQPQYKLQAMKWGFVPFWQKHQQGYGEVMKTINCRDDSLAQAGRLWQYAKKKNRCVVIAQGFFEWLKKDGGKERIPHYIKRKDGQLMCFAGLWDCTIYERDTKPSYSYTIITTNSNKQLSFLHDRMPVILENGSADMFKWLDTRNQEWTPDLQHLLKPFEGELECYAVPKEVGKVGNNSASFVIPREQSKSSINQYFSSSPKKPVAKQGFKSAAELMHHNKQLEEDQDPLNDVSNNNIPESETNAPKPEGKHALDTTDAVQNIDEPVEKRARAAGSAHSPERDANADTAHDGPDDARKISQPESSPRKKGAAAGSMDITSFLTKSTG